MAHLANMRNDWREGQIGDYCVVGNWRAYAGDMVGMEYKVNAGAHISHSHSTELKPTWTLKQNEMNRPQLEQGGQKKNNKKLHGM